jgi:hypothetical protein
MVTCEQEIKKIEEALPSASEDKREMLLEVIDFLKILEQGIEPQNY